MECTQKSKININKSDLKALNESFKNNKTNQYLTTDNRNQHFELALERPIKQNYEKNNSVDIGSLHIPNKTDFKVILDFIISTKIFYYIKLNKFI